MTYRSLVFAARRYRFAPAPSCVAESEASGSRPNPPALGIAARGRARDGLAGGAQPERLLKLRDELGQ